MIDSLFFGDRMLW